MTAELHSDLRRQHLPIEGLPVMMTLTEIRKDKAHVAAQRLIALMPATAVAHALGIQPQDLLHDRLRATLTSRVGLL